MTKPTSEMLIDIADFLLEEVPDLGMREIDDLLASYARRWNLPAMYRYMVWAKAQGDEHWMIVANIFHDLNGMDTPCFSPRTASY